MQTEEQKQLIDEIIRTSENFIAQVNQSDSIASLKRITQEYVATLSSIVESDPQVPNS